VRRRRPSGWFASGWFASGWLAAALLSAVLVFVAPFGTRAQGLTIGGMSGGGAPGRQKVTISAASGIEWQQDAKVYIARGHAMAMRGTTRVYADTLTARYRQGKGGTEIYRIDADGHVVIKGPTQTITGDHAVYDADQQVAVITGRHLRLTTASEVVTARDSLEWYEQKQAAVARGDALAVRGEKRIRADVLTAYMSRSSRAPSSNGTSAAREAARGARRPAGAASDEIGAGNSRIERIDAQGNVIVANAADVGRGDYGVYDAKTGIVTLLGNVVLTRGQDVIRGQYAVMDLNHNVSRIMSVATRPGGKAPRVEGIFVRQGATLAAGPVHDRRRQR
jgi:lipopolysaccharide export system protein LptA